MVSFIPIFFLLFALFGFVTALVGVYLIISTKNYSSLGIFILVANSIIAIVLILTTALGFYLSYSTSKVQSQLEYGSKRGLNYYPPISEDMPR